MNISKEILTQITRKLDQELDSNFISGFITELEKCREELFIRERDTKNECRELKERNQRQYDRFDKTFLLNTIAIVIYFPA